MSLRRAGYYEQDEKVSVEIFNSSTCLSHRINLSNENAGENADFRGERITKKKLWTFGGKMQNCKYIRL